MSNLLFPAALAVVGGALYYANKSRSTTQAGRASAKPTATDPHPECVDFRALYKDVAHVLGKQAEADWDDLRFWETPWRGHSLIVSMIGQHQPGFHGGRGTNGKVFKLISKSEGAASDVAVYGRYQARVRRGPERWIFTVCGTPEANKAFVTAVRAQARKRR